MNITADGLPATPLTRSSHHGCRQISGCHCLCLLGVIAVGTLCAATRAQAAVAYIQGNSVTPGTQSTVTTTFSSAQTASDLNIVFIGWEDTTSQVSSVTDTSGNVYVLANRNVFPGIGQQV